MQIKPTRMMVILLLAIPLLSGCHSQSGRQENGNVPGAIKDEGGKADWDISREEFERQKGRLQKEARQQGRKIGDGSEDLWIWAKTRGALGYADDLRDVTINVDVENAVVTLSGTLPNEDQKTKAEEIARSIDGVKSVKNALIVSTDQGVG
jgi:hypothetical protein